MKVNNCSSCDRVVWDVEVNSVIGSQSGGAPVDLHDFCEPVLNIEPIADFVWLADLEGDSGDDAPKEILSGKTKDDRGNAGAGEQSLELGFRVVTEVEDEQQGDQINE